MIPLAFDEVASLALGDLRGDAPGGTITRIHADSRIARPGDLFVALNTGVQFADDARGRGAAVLIPQDQHEALAVLARLVRSRSAARVVAVVGSTGKTSTKDALGALCAAVTPTVFPEGSLNNEIGLPLTVLRLEPDTDVLVAEMGMRGKGQIAELCVIAEPRIALVTSIGPEHLELVGTVADVAAANAEAIQALPPGGVAVVPVDAVELEPLLTRRDIEIRRFDPEAVERVGAGWRFDVRGRSVELELPFDQRHLAGNVSAALHAYDALGLPLERAQEGAARIELSRWRGEMVELPGGGLVINDAYNANPASMRAALLDLAERAHGRRTVAVLGEMAELGAGSRGYHEELGELAGRLGIDLVVGVGETVRPVLARAQGETAWIAGVADFPSVAARFRPGDVVLVKASRAVGLEGIAGEIAKIARAW